MVHWSQTEIHNKLKIGRFVLLDLHQTESVDTASLASSGCSVV